MANLNDYFAISGDEDAYGSPFVDYNLTEDYENYTGQSVSGNEVHLSLPRGELRLMDLVTGKSNDFEDDGFLEYVKKKYNIKEKEDDDNSPPPTGADPAPPEAVSDTNEAIAVSLAPDVCKTPCGASTPPIPYSVCGTANNDQNYSPNVHFNGHPAMRYDSQFSETFGAEPGIANGIKSNTNCDIVEPKSGSTIVYINGEQCIRHQDSCTLNKGNAPGEFIFVKNTTAIAPPSDTDQKENTDDRSELGKGWDGFSGSMSDAWGGVKSLASDGWDGTKNLASNLWNNPIDTIGAGINNRLQAAKGAIDWTHEVGQNLVRDPLGTLARGRDNALNSGQAIWTGVSEPYIQAYQEGGLSQAIGRGTGDLLILGVEVLGSKGALTVASKAAKAARLANTANKIEHVVDDIPSNKSHNGKPKNHNGDNDTKDAHKKNDDKDNNHNDKSDNQNSNDNNNNDGNDGARITGTNRRRVPCFEMPDGMSATEFDRQLKEQMSVINNMTADEMGYAMWVRDAAGGTKDLRQKTAQTNHRKEYAEYLRKNNWSKSDIKEHMESLQATHRLDMIAGGDPAVFSRDKNGNPILGHADVNEQIGRQWIKKDENGMRKADHLKDEANKMRKSGNKKEKMNILLERCK